MSWVQTLAGVLFLCWAVGGWSLRYSKDWNLGGERRAGGVCSSLTVRVERLSSSLFTRRKASPQVLIKLRHVRPWARRPRRAARPDWVGGLGGNGCICMCGWAPWLSARNYDSIVVFLFVWLCRVEFPDQGSKLGPLDWERGVLTSGPPGKSLTALLISSSPIENKKLFVCFLKTCQLLTQCTIITCEVRCLACPASGKWW